VLATALWSASLAHAAETTDEAAIKRPLPALAPLEAVPSAEPVFSNDFPPPPPLDPSYVPPPRDTRDEIQ
ncbi:MAG: hypothetical protein ACREXT_15260, partial [Gammaproteobacteria bacterium]